MYFPELYEKLILNEIVIGLQMQDTKQYFQVLKASEFVPSLKAC